MVGEALAGAIVLPGRAEADRPHPRPDPL